MVVIVQSTALIQYLSNMRPPPLSNTEEIYRMVAAFHEYFGIRAGNFIDATAKMSILRADLIHEEFIEYTQAEDNRIERVDALADLAYVTAGAMHQLGIECSAYSTQLPVPRQANAWLPLAAEAARCSAELRKGKLCQRGLHGALNTLLQRIDDAARVQGVDLVDAVREVHRSNMSKAWNAAQVEDAPRDAIVRLRNDGKYTVTRPDGKILKPSGYSKADLSRF